VDKLDYQDGYSGILTPPIPYRRYTGRNVADISQSLSLSIPDYAADAYPVQDAGGLLRLCIIGSDRQDCTKYGM
jgi:hypothetical protein